MIIYDTCPRYKYIYIYIYKLTALYGNSDFSNELAHCVCWLEAPNTFLGKHVIRTVIMVKYAGRNTLLWDTPRDGRMA